MYIKDYILSLVWLKSFKIAIVRIGPYMLCKSGCLK